MNKCCEALKKNNIRLTPQRTAVYQVLCSEQKHLTAEQIFEKIKPNYPAISFATVYSILDLLLEKKLIKEIRIQFDKSYFDIRVDDHHHFYCKECGKTFDIDIPLCSTLKTKIIQGNAIEDFQGYFYGTCKQCKGITL